MSSSHLKLKFAARLKKEFGNLINSIKSYQNSHVQKRTNWRYFILVEWIFSQNCCFAAPLLASSFICRMSPKWHIIFVRNSFCFCKFDTLLLLFILWSPALLLTTSTATTLWWIFLKLEMEVPWNGWKNIWTLAIAHSFSF